MLVQRIDKRIISLGFQIPRTDESSFFNFTTKGSLSDADVVVFYPNFRQSKHYNSHSTRSYKNKKDYLMDYADSIKDEISHWQNEIEHYLKNGNTLFVIIKEVEEFYLTKSTYDRVNASNYSYLPFGSYFGITTAKGNDVVPCHDYGQNFYRSTKNEVSFEGYLEMREIKHPIFKTKNGSKCLGAILDVMGGKVVFLPHINFYDKYYHSGVWSQKGVEAYDKFVRSLVEIDNLLKTPKAAKSLPPEWMSEIEIKFSIEKLISEKVNEHKKEIEKIEEKIEKLNSQNAEISILKDLLYETGVSLEEAVISALHLMGFKAEGFNDGKLELDQIIISPDGKRYIGECEGKDKKAIDIDKFRQLQDAILEDNQKEDVKEMAYGLLFGNPQRLIKINERTLDFTEKCKSAAQRQKYGLIQTSDLFIVARYLYENSDEDFKEKCRNSIFQQLGGVIKFPNIPVKVKEKEISKN